MRRLALYAGGFLGPFGGGVLTVLIPDLRDQFGVSTAAASAVIPAYIVPFAVFQLVSGTIGERLGPGRVVRAAYLMYAVTSVFAALTSGFDLLLVARALQGVANAFTTPLLLAALAGATAPAALGRTMGTFAAVQTVGIVTAPLCGGLAGAVDFRLAFVVPALAALVLAAVPLPGRAGTVPAEPPRLRAALNRRVGWLAAAAFLAYLAVTGLGFLVALRAADAFGVGATARGLMLAGFGVSGVLAGRWAGGLVDRHGRAPVTIAGALSCAALVPLLGIAPSPAALGAVWVATGAGSALLWAGLNTLTVEAAPANRGGAVSFIGAWKFGGNAAAPAVLLPLYGAHAWSAFAAAGVLSALIAGAVRAAVR
jgi:MFS family permease